MQNTETPPAAQPEGGFVVKGDQGAGTDAGFKLPSETGALPDQAKPVTGAGTTPLEVAPVPDTPVADTSTRDMAIGGAVFLVLLIVFFFVRNAYVHHLVVKRVAPSTAGNAGWLLFLGLAFVSSAAVLAMINASQFMSLAIGGPLLLVGLISLVASVFVGRR